METIPESEAITGYPVKIAHRSAFKITGFTLLVLPNANHMVGEFWDQCLADGRVQKLLAASSAATPLLGLGSWDRECERDGFRYTIGIAETPLTDFSALREEYPLFTKDIDASDWLCFEMTLSRFFERFLQDDPYKMMGPLGYKFNRGGLNLGLHFEVYPPDFNTLTDPNIEFWITVKPK